MDLRLGERFVDRRAARPRTGKKSQVGSGTADRSRPSALDQRFGDAREGAIEALPVKPPGAEFDEVHAPPILHGIVLPKLVSEGLRPLFIPCSHKE